LLRVARTGGSLSPEMQNFRQLNTFKGVSNRGVPVVITYLRAKWQLSKKIQDCIFSCLLSGCLFCCGHWSLL